MIQSTTNGKKDPFAKSYKNLAIETASPGKIILMLFDGALRFMQAAIDGFKIEKLATRNEAINNNLTKALNILAELQSSLNLSVKGEFPVVMFELYDYMQRELTRANTQKDAAPIQCVYKMLQEVREAWTEMLQKKDIPEPQVHLSSEA